MATFVGPSHCFKCHADGVGCSASVGVTSSWIKPSHEVQGFSDHSGIRYITWEFSWLKKEKAWESLAHE